MNNLSLMIYFADVVGKLVIPIVIVAIAIGVAGIVTTIIGNIPWTEWSSESEETKAENKKLKAKLQRIGPCFIIMSVFSFFTYSMIPSSKTIYLIAASEAGETVVRSPEAQEMFNDLKSIIKRKLKDEVGEVK